LFTPYTFVWRGLSSDGQLMTNEMMDQAVARWRLLTPEQVEAEMSKDPLFRQAIYEAGARGALDPSQKFWEIDAAGWGKKQYNVRTPPPGPKENDINKFVVPIPGAAFPS
jgi:hypothetical protein